MKRAYSYAVTGVIIFLVWYLLSAALDSPVVPYPLEVLLAFEKNFLEKIFVHLLSSMRRIFIAIAAAFVAALPLGIMMGRIRSIDRLVSPVLYFFYPIPKIAFLPIILIVMGLGEASKVFLIAIIVFFHLAIAIRDSTSNISEELFYSLKVMGAGRRHFIRHIIIPSILPSVFTALRISLGTSIAVLFFSETIVTDTGIGFLIMDSWIRVDYPEMYASIISLSLMGLLLFGAVDFAESRICRWKKAK